MRKHINKIRITSVVLVILLIITVYLFAFSLKASSRPSGNTMEFNEKYDDAEGFVDANLLNNQNKLVADNTNLELYLDETTSHFYVKDLTTGEIIRSNPIMDDNNPDVQKATMTFRYFNVN